MRPEDLDRLAEVSRTSGAMFRGVGIELPPDDARATLRHASWVLVAGGQACGFAAMGELDGAAHLEELAVHPDHGRRGVGSALLRAARATAAERGYRSMTLTTFRDVVWNAPWYAARGFAEFPAKRWGPQLRTQWQAETEAGIMVAPRVAMRAECVS